MNRDDTDPAEVQHPLRVLEQIEAEFASDLELGLRDMGTTPWAELLVEYVDALTELAEHGPEFHVEGRPGPEGE